MQRLTRPALPVIEEGAAREDDVHVARASPGGAEPRVNVCTARPLGRVLAVVGRKACPRAGDGAKPQSPIPEGDNMDEQQQVKLTAAQRRAVDFMTRWRPTKNVALRMVGHDRSAGMTFALATLPESSRYWTRRAAAHRARMRRGHARPGRHLAAAGHPSCCRCGAHRPTLLTDRWQRSAIACGACRALLYRCGCDSGDTEVLLWRGRLQCQNCGVYFGVVTRRGRTATT